MAAVRAIRDAYRAALMGELQHYISADDPSYEDTRAFGLNRFDEGVELAAHFRREYGDRRVVILDVGAGNGGVVLGLSTDERNFPVAVDVDVNRSIVKAAESCDILVRQVVASADSLPFRDGCCDVVLSLETIEHLERPAVACTEMMRVLAAGGQAMVTTAPRVRFLFRRDPHRAIPGLLLLPDRLQKFVVDRILHNPRPYDVRHIYWTARGIVGTFPDRGRTAVMVNASWPPPPRQIADFWRLFIHHFRKRLRNILWDRIVIYKR